MIEITREEKNSVNWLDCSRTIGIKWKDFKEMLTEEGEI